MRHFHGEVKTDNVYESDNRAEEIAGRVGDEIRRLDGRIDVGRNFGDAPAVLIVQLPDGVALDPNELVQDVHFVEVHATSAPAVPDQGVRE